MRLAILPLLLWEQRRLPTKIIIYGFLAILAFSALDPFLWLDPIGRLGGMFSFHSAFPQSDWVKQQDLPWWYASFTLPRSVSVLPAPLLHEHSPMSFLAFAACSKMLAQMLLPNMVYNWLWTLRASVRSEATPPPAGEEVEKVSVDDFLVTETGLDECINLAGICEC